MKNYGFGLLAAALLAGGCVATPVRPAPPLVTPVAAASSQLQQERAAAFKRLTAAVKVRGVGLFADALKGEFPAEELLDRMAQLGFNRIYCYVSSETQLDDTLRDFIAAASGRGFMFEVVLNQRDFYRRPTGNRLIRFFRPSYPRLDEVAAKLAEFNAALPADGKLAGMTVIVEPHRFTATNPDLPPDAIYYWSDATFGSGLDNAMLMQEALELLKRVAVAAPGLPFTIGVADFYHELAADGRLPLGRISDFCAISPRVLLLDSGNKPSEAAAVVENELAAIPPGGVALVGINLAGHTSVDSGALRRRDWNDLLRGIRYILERFERHPSFDGFVIAPFSALEFMRMERD